MLHRYSLEDETPRLVQGDTPGQSGYYWYDLEAPDEDECLTLAQTLRIPLEHLRAALDINERPRMELSDDILLIVARAAVSDDTGRRVPYSPVPSPSFSLLGRWSRYACGRG